jgi:hypothetical protein
MSGGLDGGWRDDERRPRRGTRSERRRPRWGLAWIGAAAWPGGSRWEAVVEEEQGRRGAQGAPVVGVLDRQPTTGSTRSR